MPDDKVLVTKSKLDSLADMISAKSGEPVTMTIDEMTSAVESIKTDFLLQEKTVTPTTLTQVVLPDNGQIILNEPIIYDQSVDFLWTYPYTVGLFKINGTIEITYNNNTSIITFENQDFSFLTYTQTDYLTDLVITGDIAAQDLPTLIEIGFYSDNDQNRIYLGLNFTGVITNTDLSITYDKNYQSIIATFESNENNTITCSFDTASFSEGDLCDIEIPGNYYSANSNFRRSFIWDGENHIFNISDYDYATIITVDVANEIITVEYPSTASSFWEYDGYVCILKGAAFTLYDGLSKVTVLAAQEPSGNIDLYKNDESVDVTDYATATPKIPLYDKINLDPHMPFNTYSSSSTFPINLTSTPFYTSDTIHASGTSFGPYSINVNYDGATEEYPNFVCVLEGTLSVINLSTFLPTEYSIVYDKDFQHKFKIYISINPDSVLTYWANFDGYDNVFLPYFNRNFSNNTFTFSSMNDYINCELDFNIKYYYGVATEGISGINSKYLDSISLSVQASSKGTKSYSIPYKRISSNSSTTTYTPTSGGYKQKNITTSLSDTAYIKAIIISFTQNNKTQIQSYYWPEQAPLELSTDWTEITLTSGYINSSDHWFNDVIKIKEGYSNTLVLQYAKADTATLNSTYDESLKIIYAQKFDYYNNINVSPAAENKQMINIDPNENPQGVVLDQYLKVKSSVAPDTTITSNTATLEIPIDVTNLVLYNRYHIKGQFLIGTSTTSIACIDLDSDFIYNEYYSDNLTFSSRGAVALKPASISIENAKIKVNFDSSASRQLCVSDTINISKLNTCEQIATYTLSNNEAGHTTDIQTIDLLSFTTDKICTIIGVDQITENGVTSNIVINNSFSWPEEGQYTFTQNEHEITINLVQVKITNLVANESISLHIMFEQEDAIANKLTVSVNPESVNKLQAKTVTPTSTAQVITADNGTLIGRIPATATFTEESNNYIPITLEPSQTFESYQCYKMQGQIEFIGGTVINYNNLTFIYTPNYSTIIPYTETFSGLSSGLRCYLEFNTTNNEFNLLFKRTDTTYIYPSRYKVSSQVTFTKISQYTVIDSSYYNRGISSKTIDTTGLSDNDECALVGAIGQYNSITDQIIVNKSFTWDSSNTYYFNFEKPIYSPDLSHFTGSTIVLNVALTNNKIQTLNNATMHDLALVRINNNSDVYDALSQVTINPIPSSYHDTSNVTATSSDVLYPKVIVDANGVESVGTIEEMSSADVETSVGVYSNENIFPYSIATAGEQTWEQGTFNSNNGEELANNNRVRVKSSAAIAVTPNTSYTISKDDSASNYVFQLVIYAYNDNDEWISADSIIDWIETYPYIYTPATATKIRLAMRRLLNENEQSISTSYVNEGNFKIEEGTIVTELNNIDKKLITSINIPSGYYDDLDLEEGYELTSVVNLIDKTYSNERNCASIIVADTYIGVYSNSKSAVNSTANSQGTLNTNLDPMLSFYWPKTFRLVGRIDVIDENNNILEYYNVDKNVTFNGTRQTIVDNSNNINAYYSLFEYHRSGNSNTTAAFEFTCAKTAKYGFKLNLDLYEKNDYCGLNSVIIDPPKYSNELMNNFITRSAYFKSFEFPDGITSIGGYAFAGCNYLALTNLPNTITQINNYAFYNCTNLALSSLPSGITYIGTYAFYYCSSLTLTSLPSGITNIQAYAFYNCSKLALTSLPSSLTGIQNGAFGNTKIASLTLPSTVTTIGNSAFEYCTSLTSFSMSSATNLTTIPSYAFRSCQSLTTVTFPSALTKIDTYAFNMCINLVITTLPDTLTSIAQNAFQHCISLTSISCDGAITTLGSNAFTGGGSYLMTLQSASFPNLATTSGLSYVFGSATAAQACQQLAFVDLGQASSLSTNCFTNCYALQTLVLRRTSAICALSGGTAVFTNTPVNGYNNLTATIYVPSALISTYQTASNWKTFYNNGTVTFSAIEGSQYEIT